MTRLAKGRTTHLSAEEIATEMLRQFDESGGAPTIRGLAAALSCTPKAIYHYYATRAELEQAAVDLVWDKAIAAVVEELSVRPELADDPVEVLIFAAVATRRAFASHWRISFHLGAPPEANDRMSGGLAILGSLFEQMGLEEEEIISLAWYSYIMFTLGSILLAASRRATESETGKGASFSTAGKLVDEAGQLLPDAPTVRDETVRAIDRTIETTRADPAVDEALFTASLRTLLRSFQRTPA